MNIDNLLTPSLDSDKRNAKIFSEQALFFVAFFGGVFSAILMSAMNSLRLNRLKKDLWLYVFVSILYSFFLYFYFNYYTQNPESYNSNNTRLMVRLISIFVWFLFFLAHKKTHRVSEFVSDSYEKPWLYGISIVIIGSLISFGLVFIINYYLN